MIIAISAWAALLPALSIRSAALRHSSRDMSMSIRARATRCSQIDCARMSFLPNATRDCSRLHHRLQRFLGRADRAHAMVDAARPEPALRDLEAAPFAEQQVRRRHAHVLQHDLHMAVRRVVIAVDGERAQDVEAGRVERHQDHRLLAVLVGALVGLAHQDRDLAARIAGARRPPFAAVDHIIIAVAGDVAFDVGRVGRGDRGLGHQEGRADLAVHQRPQPLLLLLARAVAVEAPPYCRCRAPSS